MRPGLKDFVELDSSSGHITLSTGQQIVLHCSRGFKTPLGGTKAVATCASGKQFEVNNKRYEFTQFACKAYPDHKTRITNRTCVGGNIVEIGFEVETKWFSLMEVCHVGVRGETLWVHYKQTPKHWGFQRAVARISFIQADFYKGLRVESLYTREVQRKTIAKILGSSELASKLIAAKSDVFLARGHLAAKSDFIYGSQQLATFYFINAAPQWQTFNAGNWADVETDTKKYFDKKNLNVEVYTGTYGTLKFKDINDNLRDLFLASDSNNTTQRIPVPKLYYKLVIAPKERAGIVFVGVNNPHATLQEIKKEYIICKDVSDQVKYISWKKADIQLGYSYACEISDFLKTVEHLPKLQAVEKLLL